MMAEFNHLLLRRREPDTGLPNLYISDGSDGRFALLSPGDRFQTKPAGANSAKPPVGAVGSGR
jgi:hypothetical protein